MPPADLNAEADVGVSEDICHFYFTQLVAGLSYIHGEGVAHRGIRARRSLCFGMLTIR